MHADEISLMDRIRLPQYESYDDLLACEAWNAGLKSLNAHLANCLADAGQKNGVERQFILPA